MACSEEMEDDEGGLLESWVGRACAWLSEGRSWRRCETNSLHVKYGPGVGPGPCQPILPGGGRIMLDVIGPGALSRASRQADMEVQSRESNAAGHATKNRENGEGIAGLRDCGIAAQLQPWPSGSYTSNSSHQNSTEALQSLGSWNTRSLARGRTQTSPIPCAVLFGTSLGMQHSALILYIAALQQGYIRHSRTSRCRPARRLEPVQGFFFGILGVLLGMG